MEVDKQLYEEIKEYCELNGLKPREFANSLLKKAFMEEKYGKMPAVVRPADKPVEKTSKKVETVEESRQESGQSVSIPEIATESRQDSRQDVAKEEKPAKNDDFRDKSETKTTDDTVLKDTNPKNTQESKEVKRTIKKRTL